ncbi:MAG: hypothetical protein KDE49_18970, partial [Novosphingobium sp.]|nr:hypothetical protein [Novosphingobium sp.]
MIGAQMSMLTVPAFPAIIACEGLATEWLLILMTFLIGGGTAINRLAGDLRNPPSWLEQHSRLSPGLYSRHRPGCFDVGETVERAGSGFPGLRNAYWSARWIAGERTRCAPKAIRIS